MDKNQVAAFIKDETYDPVNLAEDQDTPNNEVQHCSGCDNSDCESECQRIFNDIGGLGGSHRIGGPQSDPPDTRGECPGNLQHSPSHTSGQVQLGRSDRVYLCAESKRGCRGIADEAVCAGCQVSRLCPLCGKAAAQWGKCEGVLHRGTPLDQRERQLLAPTEHRFECSRSDSKLAETLFCKKCRKLTGHCPLDRKTCGRRCLPLHN